MQKCKIKKQAEVKVQKSKSISETINEIQKDFVIQTILIIIVSLLSVIVCFRKYKTSNRLRSIRERKTSTRRYCRNAKQYDSRFGRELQRFIHRIRE